MQIESQLMAPARFGPAASVRGWIGSAGFDLAFFILSPLVGLLVIFGTQHSPLGTALAVGASYLIGVPHYLSSFSFFLGDENLRHYRTRFAVFFIVPILILATVLALRVMAVAHVVQATIFVWNVYHVAAQSAGILSLYRRLGGGDQSERFWGLYAIVFVYATMAFWYVERFQPLHALLTVAHPAIPGALPFFCLAGAIYFGLGYAMRLMRRAQPMALPEKAFLATSLLLFHPYLWVEDSHLATLGMLMGHFIQYLAIVWLLNRRKFVPASGSRRQQWLGKVSASLPLLLAAIVCSGLLFYAMDKGSRLLEISTAYVILFNSLALVHFYIDGLVWAFKNPFVRQSIGPFLSLETHRIRG